MSQKNKAKRQGSNETEEKSASAKKRKEAAKQIDPARRKGSTLKAPVRQIELPNVLRQFWLRFRIVLFYCYNWIIYLLFH
jgi:hypothetical protein